MFEGKWLRGWGEKEEMPGREGKRMAGKEETKKRRRKRRKGNGTTRKMTWGAWARKEKGT